MRLYSVLVTPSEVNYNEIHNCIMPRQALAKSYSILDTGMHLANILVVI